MTDSAHDDACGCYRCKLRSLSFGSVPGGARQNRVLKEHELPAAPSNAWERGTARIDGVPLLDTNLNPVPIKRYVEQRHHIHDRLAAVKAAGTDNKE